MAIRVKRRRSFNKIVGHYKKNELLVMLLVSKFF
jgi:hypothetical protein